LQIVGRVGKPSEVAALSLTLRPAPASASIRLEHGAA
jgi:hypothetical protein